MQPHLVDRRPRRLAPALAIALTLVAGACGTDPVSPRAEAPLTALPRTLTADERAIVDGSTGFAFSLLREVAATVPADSNLFISPISVSMALGMTMNGTAGETQAQLRRTLGFGDMTLDQANLAYKDLIALLQGIDRGVDFRIANAIWARQGFAVRPEFLARTSASFGAEAQALDFSSPATLTTINDWVKRSTNGKIEKILDQIPGDMVMYLMNAIYFNGNWRSRFDARQTAPAPFTTATGATQQVAAMRQTHGFAFYRGTGFRAVDLPYGRGAFTMTVVLPDAATPLADVIAGLDAAAWRRITAFTDTTQVELQLPKFKLADEHKLNDPLQAMGIVDAFYADRADFTPLSPVRGLEISEVKHKTFVDVHEEGTEAAAVTSVGIRETSAPPTEPFVVNRPFLFVLRERFSGAILFVGRIGKLPTQ